MQLECVGNDEGIGYSDGNANAKGEYPECTCLQMKLGQ